MSSTQRTSAFSRPAKAPGSPRLELNGTTMSALQQQRLRASRQQSATAVQGAPGSLRLPGVPRFHPANFPSANSSMQSTPTGQNSAQPLMSPRSHSRQMSEAQRALYSYQRDFFSSQAAIAQVTAVHRRHGSGSSNGNGSKPLSPRLHPAIDSPGPMTPLELEGDGGYLTAGLGASNNAERADYIERIIKEQTERMQTGNISPSGNRVPSSPVTPIGSY